MNNEFKIPKNYFKDVESKILESTKNEFDIPNNYFEDFEKNIVEKISKKKEIPVIFLKTITIAASIFLLIAIYYKNNHKTIEFSDINQEEIIDYLSDNMDTESLDNEIELSEINIENNLPKNELIEYLEDNEIDEELYNNI